MFCRKCGAKNQDDSFFCAMCGASLRSGADSREAGKPETGQSSSNMSQASSCPPGAEAFSYGQGQYAYARIAGQKEDSYYCECIDGRSAFFAGKEFARRSDQSQAVIGDYVWAYLMELTKTVQGKNRYKVRLLAPNPSPSSAAIRKEFGIFCLHHGCGEPLRAPIESVQPEYLVVRLSPNLTGLCFRRDLPRQIRPESLNPGDIKEFVIDQIQAERSRVVLKLQETNTRDKMCAHLWSQLPASIRDVVIPKKLLNVIADSDEDGAFSRKIGQELTARSLCAFLEPLYQQEYQERRITVKQNASTYFMDFDTGLKNAKGAPVSAAFKKNKQEDKWIMNLFGFTSVESVFDRFVYTEDMDASMNELAELALGGEEWDYGGAGERGNKHILKQYLRFNFYKSRLDGLLVVNERTGEAVFNTGLVDMAYDEIYCYLKSNTHTDDFYRRRWELSCFACWGKGRDGKRLNDKFDVRPKAPQYIDPDRIQDIYYDVTKPLSCDYDHIIADNLGRLPLDFLRRKLSYNPEILREIDTYTASHAWRDFAVLKELILHNETCLRDVVDGLKTAVETAKKYCKWNYKTAIPIYYPRNNNVSLLLPLCLSNNNSKADVALVVERLENGNYQGQTILTLQMAYLDARQICRPNSEWLTAGNIEQSGDDSEPEYGD